MRDAHAAPAHIGHGSRVTASVTPVEPPRPDVPPRRRGGRGPRRGRWGRRCSSRSLCAGRRPGPSSTTTAPMGTSPWSAAAIAWVSASSIDRSQSGSALASLTTMDGTRLEPPTSAESDPTVRIRQERRAGSGGGGGIRTHGELPHTRFPGVPIRPLSHLSGGRHPRAAGRPGQRSRCRRYADPGRALVRRSGPVQSEPVNRVRAGRQQLSAEPAVCRRSPDRHHEGTAHRVVGAAEGRPAVGSAVAYQSLYRRYRPRRFAEVRGQDHVVHGAAQRRRVRGPSATPTCSADRAAPARRPRPASSPRPSTATNLQDGEPCGVCESCLAIEAGTSLRPLRARRGVQQRRRDHARPRSSAAVGSPGAHARCTSSTRSTCSRRGRPTPC